jgi:saccharopine dehydrogenase-like NADP-dependent oxidoreductase
VKVFTLEGHGAIGLPSAELLAESELVTEIAVAGRSVERAEQAAAEIGKNALPVKLSLASVTIGRNLFLTQSSGSLVWVDYAK